MNYSQDSTQPTTAAPQSFDFSLQADSQHFMQSDQWDGSAGSQAMHLTLPSDSQMENDNLPPSNRNPVFHPAQLAQYLELKRQFDAWQASNRIPGNHQNTGPSAAPEQQSWVPSQQQWPTIPSADQPSAPPSASQSQQPWAPPPASQPQQAWAPPPASQPQQTWATASGTMPQESWSAAAPGQSQWAPPPAQHEQQPMPASHENSAAVGGPSHSSGGSAPSTQVPQQPSTARTAQGQTQGPARPRQPSSNVPLQRPQFLARDPTRPNFTVQLQFREEPEFVVV